MNTKFCVNCKYFVELDQFTSKYYGCCTKFPKIDSNKIEYLVTGKEIKEYYLCRTARNFDSMCGEEGKMYEPKEN